MYVERLVDRRSDDAWSRSLNVRSTSTERRCRAIDRQKSLGRIGTKMMKQELLSQLETLKKRLAAGEPVQSEHDNLVKKLNELNEMMNDPRKVIKG